MRKRILYVLIVCAVLALPLVNASSQEPKQEKKRPLTPVTMDMEDVIAKSNGGNAVRDGATSQLELRSTGNDFIGKGLSELYQASDGAFSAHPGPMKPGTKDVKEVDLKFVGKDGGWIMLVFAAPEKSYGLLPGYYTDAVRSGLVFELRTNPGLSITANGRGCGKVSGDFQVYEAEYDISKAQPKVISFVAKFTQHCNDTGTLEGMIYYNAVPPKK